MSDAARYPVDTLMDMARIPEEALPRFLEELPVLLAQARPLLAITEAVGGKVASSGSVWIDDAEQTFKTRVRHGDEVVFEAEGRFGPGRSAE